MTAEAVTEKEAASVPCHISASGSDRGGSTEV